MRAHRNMPLVPVSACWSYHASNHIVYPASGTRQAVREAATGFHPTTNTATTAAADSPPAG